MSRTLEFIFDFGSPNAYLAYRALPPLLARTGATLRISPCLLGGIFKATGNQPPLLAYGNVKAKMEYEQMEIRRFVEAHNISNYRFNPHFPVNTLMLMRGAIHAQRSGVLDPYMEAGLACMWEKGLKMDDADIFRQAFTDAGLDGEAILTATQDPAVKEQLATNTHDAVARGVFGIPTFFVGDAMFFGKDRLGQVEAALLAA